MLLVEGNEPELSWNCSLIINVLNVLVLSATKAYAWV